MNKHEEPSYNGFFANNTTKRLRIGSITFEKSNISAFYKPIRIHCKTNGLSARPVFETKGKCQDFVARYKDDGLPTKLIVQFDTSKPTLQSVNPSHLKTEKSENDFRFFGKLSRKCRELFPERDDTNTYNVHELNVRSKVRSIKDRKNGVGKPVFKLASFGS